MIPLEPENTYHIYNRANGNEKIFTSDDNYTFFLRQYKTYVSPVANSFCYCLMPNHFHFLLRIKSEDELAKTFPKFASSKNPQGFISKDLQGFKNLEGLISNQFGKFFNSYAKAFNKQQSRMGSLFMKNFKRKRITDEKYLHKVVHYIHFNPVKSGLCYKPADWKFSSYNSILNHEDSKNHQGFILKEEVIDWFGDKENFIHCHRLPAAETGIE